eukprot:9467560-Pyramimonas_sp.AAC.1
MILTGMESGFSLIQSTNDRRRIPNTAMATLPTTMLSGHGSASSLIADIPNEGNDAKNAASTINSHPEDAAIISFVTVTSLPTPSLPSTATGLTPQRFG